MTGFSGCAGRLNSPKVLRFSMDINSCLSRELGVSLLWWSEKEAMDISLRREAGEWSCACSGEVVVWETRKHALARWEGGDERSGALFIDQSIRALASPLPINPMRSLTASG